MGAERVPVAVQQQQRPVHVLEEDDRGWPVYQYFYNGQPMWLHFYDEGLFYDGFYIINDLEDGYEEADGRVYIYNSDSDECVEDTGRNWYYWSSNRWIYDESI